jgi:hypothetical protein
MYEQVTPSEFFFTVYTVLLIGSHSAIFALKRSFIEKALGKWLISNTSAGWGRMLIFGFVFSLVNTK